MKALTDIGINLGFYSDKIYKYENCVYIIQVDLNIFKIGVTGDIFSRLSGLHYGTPHNIFVRHLAYTRKIEIARKIEKYLHHKLERFNIKGEWFNFEYDNINVLLDFDYTKLFKDVGINDLPNNLEYFLLSKKMRNTISLAKSQHDNYVKKTALHGVM